MLDLPVGQVWVLRSMRISTSTLNDAPAFCGLQPALDRQFGDTLLHDFFGLHNSCRATFFSPLRGGPFF